MLSLAKLFPQPAWLHTNGLSPVCARWCLNNWLFGVKLTCIQDGSIRAILCLEESVGANLIVRWLALHLPYVFDQNNAATAGHEPNKFGGLSSLSSPTPHIFQKSVDVASCEVHTTTAFLYEHAKCCNPSTTRDFKIPLLHSCAWRNARSDWIEPLFIHFRCIIEHIIEDGNMWKYNFEYKISADPCL